MLNAPADLQPITWNDYEIYQKFFRAAPGTAVYANSWSYITQACRGLGLGWKYLDADRLYSIGLHNGHYVIVNPLGVLDSRLDDLLARLNSLSGRPVFIKKTSGVHAASLEKSGAVPASEVTYRWDTSAYADDDTYPELIICPKVSLGYWKKPGEWLQHYRTVRNGSPAGDEHSTRAGFRQFRRYVRRASESNTTTEVVEYSPEMYDAIYEWVQTYFDQSRPEAPRAYDSLLDGLRRGIRSTSEFCFVVKRAGTTGIGGVIFGERLDAGSAAIYARLIQRSHPGLPEYAMAQVLAHLDRQGIHRLNLGGSENLGLHTFKKKLAPIEERLLPLLVYGDRRGL